MQVESTRPRLTAKVLLVLCAMNLIDTINGSLLMPYVDKMVATLLSKGQDDPQVALWASVLVGSYSLCEVLFSGFWGILSDRVGRRPVLLIGLAGSAVAPLLFGLSGSLPLALSFRVLDGFFCGNAGVTKTYLGEIIDASNEARAWGLTQLCYSAGSFIGPALGGLLVEPATWAPEFFAGTFFQTYPFLLPNLVYASLAVLAFVVGLCSLQETRPPRSSPSVDPRGALLTVGNSMVAPERSEQVWPPNLVKNVVAMMLLMGYATARQQTFILVTSLPRDIHGFAFGPQELGVFQMIAAIVIVVTNFTIFQPALKHLGPHGCFVKGMGLTVLTFLPFPLYGLLADRDPWGFVTIAAAVGLSQVGFTFCFASVYMIINRECAAESRGAVNGWANSLGALCRSAFPFAAGGLMALGLRAEQTRPYYLPGGRYVGFYVNVFTAAAAMWLVSRQKSPRTIVTNHPAHASNGGSQKMEGERETGLDAGNELGG